MKAYELIEMNTRFFSGENRSNFNYFFLIDSAHFVNGLTILWWRWRFEPAAEITMHVVERNDFFLIF